jgi:5'-deoxynucleotidase YfbR-like HD superfamily hydrolase
VWAEIDWLGGKVDRLEQVRLAVDEMLCRQPDVAEQRCGYIHLYGVSATCALLALKRGLDAQLAAVAGMLHDYSTYQRGDPSDHDRWSAQEARRLLAELDIFSPQEIDTICGAILHHRAKGEVHAPMDELLKDADVLQHYLYNPGFKQQVSEEPRIAAVLAELGIERKE